MSSHNSTDPSTSSMLNTPVANTVGAITDNAHVPHVSLPVHEEESTGVVEADLVQIWTV